LDIVFAITFSEMILGFLPILNFRIFILPGYNTNTCMKRRVSLQQSDSSSDSTINLVHNYRLEPTKAYCDKIPVEDFPLKIERHILLDAIV